MWHPQVTIESAADAWSGDLPAQRFGNAWAVSWTLLLLAATRLVLVDGRKLTDADLDAIADDVDVAEHGVDALKTRRRGPPAPGVGAR